MTGLHVLKLGKLQHFPSGPSPGLLPIPTAGRPQAWPGGQGFRVCLFVCEVDLHLGKLVSCGIYDHIPYRLLLASLSGSLKTDSNSHFRELGK